MKNPIIAELRRIRDDNARRHNYDLDAMARDWMKVEPWMKKKIVTLREGRIVPAFPRHTRGTRNGHGLKRN